jgi:hypothetical protein
MSVQTGKHKKNEKLARESCCYSNRHWLCDTSVYVFV